MAEQVISSRGVKTVKGPGGVLFALYWGIVGCEGVDFNNLKRLIDMYVIRTARSSAIAKRVEIRSGLDKELTKGSMTWKTFIKGLAILNVTRFRFTIEIEKADGRNSSYTKTVDIGDMSDGGNDDD
jgi:hypothetical protein